MLLHDLQPMDADETTLAGNVMQTRMQVHDSAVVYRNMSSAISSITSTEGAARLWRGVFSVILGAGPAHAVHFGTYEFVKSQGRRSQMFNEPVTNGACLVFQQQKRSWRPASRYRFALLVWPMLIRGLYFFRHSSGGCFSNDCWRWIYEPF